MTNLLNYIRTVDGFPKEGISFKDITTLAKEHAPFKESCDKIIQYFKEVTSEAVDELNVVQHNIEHYF